MNYWYQYGPPPREWWAAGYPLRLETPKDVRVANVILDDIRSAECPMSVVLRDPKADEISRIFAQAELVGVSALGEPANWPGSFYDAVGLLKAQKERDERAQERAVHRAFSS